MDTVQDRWSGRNALFRPLPSSTPIYNYDISPMVGRCRLSLTHILNEGNPAPALFSCCQISGQRERAMMRRSRPPFDCRAPPSTNPLDHGPRPDECPMIFFAFLWYFTPRGSTDSPSLRSMEMALFPSSSPSSAWLEENTSRDWAIYRRWRRGSGMTGSQG